MVFIQMVQNFRKPLIIASPKTLLRLPVCEPAMIIMSCDYHGTIYNKSPDYNAPSTILSSDYHVMYRLTIM